MFKGRESPAVKKIKRVDIFIIRSRSIDGWSIHHIQELAKKGGNQAKTSSTIPLKKHSVKAGIECY